MKKISLSLNLGIVGLNSTSQNVEKKIFIDYLKGSAIKSQIEKMDVISYEYCEFLVIFKEIPIKIKLYFLNNLNELISKYDKIKNLDVIILVANIKDANSINLFTKEVFFEFKEYYLFRGISVLVGLNIDQQISTQATWFRSNTLIEKINELEILYGFELKNEEKDLSDFFNKILEDFIFKFKVTSPELVDISKSYGRELLEKF